MRDWRCGLWGWKRSRTGGGSRCVRKCEETRTHGNQAPGLDSGFSSPYCTVCSLSLAIHLTTSSALSQPLHSSGASSLHSLSHYSLPLPMGQQMSVSSQGCPPLHLPSRPALVSLASQRGNPLSAACLVLTTTPSCALKQLYVVI